MCFVNACRLLFKPSMTKVELTIAHFKLLRFCTTFEKLYGADKVTINMHMHIHLVENALDFSSPYGWWCFSFERYNGMLGNIETNNRDGFEYTFMKQFIELSLSTTFIDSPCSQSLLDAGQREFLAAMVSNPESSTIAARLNSP